jgi:hypothetical protein
MKYILYVISVAIITMFFIYLGLLKERTLNIELTNILYRKCVRKALKYLKSHNYATIKDIQNCIKETKASVMWSKRKLAVTDASQFADYVVEGLYKEGKISIGYKGNNKVYYINKEKR